MPLRDQFDPVLASFHHHGEAERLEAALDRLNRSSALGTVHQAERHADLDTTARLARESLEDLLYVSQTARSSLQLRDAAQARTDRLREVAETCRLMAERAAEAPDKRPHAAVSRGGNTIYDRTPTRMEHDKDDLSALFLAIAAACEA